MQRGRHQLDEWNKSELDFGPVFAARELSVPDAGGERDSQRCRLLFPGVFGLFAARLHADLLVDLSLQPIRLSIRSHGGEFLRQALAGELCVGSSEQLFSSPWSPRLLLVWRVR